jgi:peptide/nickel transport system substrate-binding protein
MQFRPSLFTRCAGFALVAASLALAAPAAAQTLNVGVGAPITSLDPHFFNAGPNNGMAMHIYRFLTTRDAQLRLRPDLAERWTAVSDTVWEFKLREGVTWHDGNPVTAEDVAFSMGRAPNVPNSPGGFGGFLAGVERVEVVDARTVRFHMNGPSPLLPSNMAAVAIIARHAADGAATADFNSGKAAIGAGPYRAVSYASGDRVVLERNDAYVPADPAERRAHWARVNYRMVLNDGARVAAVLAGDVDIIDQIPGNDLARLKANPQLSVYEIQGVRMVYVAFDYARDNNQPGITDNQGQPLAQNPFRDLRVRRALSMAINREAIADRVMSGSAVPTGQWLPPGTFGYNAEVKPTAFDAEGARRLLAEAGYPNGFRLTLSTPNDRWANDAQTAQAIAQFWSRIGIATQIDAQPWAAHAGKSARNEFPIRMASWGSSTGEASYTLVNVLGTRNRETRWGAVNNGGYSNKALDALTAQALATLDDERREETLRQAVKLATDDVGLMPIHHLKNFWAARRGLTYEPRMDERTVAFRIFPAN